MQAISREALPMPPTPKGVTKWAFIYVKWAFIYFINVTYLLHGNPNDLRHLLSYPITTVPLSRAHIDGTPLKTDKATLTKALE